MPPTSLVPYSSACWLWKVPCLPVNPWQMTRESPFSFRFTRVLLYCEPQRTLAVKPSKENRWRKRDAKIEFQIFHYQKSILFVCFAGHMRTLNIAETSPTPPSASSLHPTKFTYTHTNSDRLTAHRNCSHVVFSEVLRNFPIYTIHITNVSSCHLLRHSDSTNCLLSTTNRM